MTLQVEAEVGPSVSVVEKLLWDARDITAVTGLSGSTIKRYRDRGQFPKAVRFGRRVMWQAEVIRQWIQEQGV